MGRVRVHIGAQNGVNPRLVAALPTEPVKNIPIKPHSHDRFAARPYHSRGLPEFFIGGACVGVRFDAPAYLSIAHAAQPAPVGARSALSLGSFASSAVFHAVRLATP